MATVTVDYFGMSGTGRTVTEAKRDAGAKIEAALTGDYTPQVIEWRGNVMLVFRSPTGWHYRTIVDADTGVRVGHVYGNSTGTGDLEDTLRAVRNQLAQNGWRAEDGTEAPEFIKDRHDRSDFASWARFQLRCIEGKRAGLSGVDLHAYGCGSLGREDLEERVNAALAVA